MLKFYSVDGVEVCNFNVLCKRIKHVNCGKTCFATCLNVKHVSYMNVVTHVVHIFQ